MKLWNSYEQTNAIGSKNKVAPVNNNRYNLQKSKFEGTSNSLESSLKRNSERGADRQNRLSMLEQNMVLNESFEKALRTKETKPPQTFT